MTRPYANKVDVTSAWPGYTDTSNQWVKVLQGNNSSGGFVEVQSNDAWVILRIRQTVDRVDVDTYQVIGPSSSVIVKVRPTFIVDAKATASPGGYGFSDIAGFFDTATGDPYIIATWDTTPPDEAESFSVLSTSAATILGTAPIAVSTELLFRPVKTMRELTISCTREVVLSVYSGIALTVPVEQRIVPANTSATVFVGGFGTIGVLNGALGTCNYRADWRKGVA